MAKSTSNFITVGVGFGGMVGSVFFLSWRAAILVEGDEGND